jgi:hypothetical protein
MCVAMLYSVVLLSPLPLVRHDHNLSSPNNCKLSNNPLLRSLSNSLHVRQRLAAEAGIKTSGPITPYARTHP